MSGHQQHSQSAADGCKRHLDESFLPKHSRKCLCNCRYRLFYPVCGSVLAFAHKAQEDMCHLHKCAKNQVEIKLVPSTAHSSVFL